MFQQTLSPDIQPAAVELIISYEKPPKEESINDIENQKLGKMLGQTVSLQNLLKPSQHKRLSRVTEHCDGYSCVVCGLSYSGQYSSYKTGYGPRETGMNA